MTAEISPKMREALKSQIDALAEAERKIADAIRPFKEAICAIDAAREVIFEAHGIAEGPPRCLGCERLILPGDKAQDEASGEIFCEECAASYADIKANHDEVMANGFSSELSPDDIAAFARAHDEQIAPGGSPDDKPLYVYGED